MLGFFYHRELEFDEASAHSFAAARIFAGYNKRQEITAADLLRGLLHTTSAESVKFLRGMQFGYGDEVESIKKLGKDERDSLGKGLSISKAVKKVLARANQKAVAAKREKVVFLDLLWGVVIERPQDVAKDLAQVGKAWEDLDRYLRAG